MKSKRTGFICPIPKNNSKYEVNGVKYTVSSRFVKNLNYDCISEKIERYIKSDFAHLTDYTKKDILSNEYICQTANVKGE